MISALPSYAPLLFDLAMPIALGVTLIGVLGLLTKNQISLRNYLHYVEDEAYRAKRLAKENISDFRDLKERFDQLDKPHNDQALANIKKAISKTVISKKVISAAKPRKPKMRNGAGNHVR